MRLAFTEVALKVRYGAGRSINDDAADFHRAWAI